MSACSNPKIFGEVVHFLHKLFLKECSTYYIRKECPKMSSALGCPDQGLSEAAALTPGELGAPPKWQNMKGGS